MRSLQDVAPRVGLVTFMLVLALTSAAPSRAQDDDSFFVANRGKGTALRPAPGPTGLIGTVPGSVVLKDGTALRQTGPDVVVEDTTWKPVDVRIGGTTHHGWVEAAHTSRTAPAAAGARTDEPAAPATPVPPVSPEETRRVISDAAGQGRLPRPVADAALAGGTARVIVELRLATPYRSEPTLPTAREAQDQRASIQRAQAGILAQLSPGHAASAKRFETIPYIALEVDASELGALLRRPDVASIVEDPALRAIGSPALGEQATRPRLAESVPLVGANQAWAAGFAGAGQVVAVIDTGVDKAHPFLANKVVSEACYSTTSAATSSTSICPGGVTSSTAVGSGVPCPATFEDCVHGTHVAGIAAGKGASFSGVARDAGLIAVQVFTRRDSAAVCSPEPAPCLKSFGSDITLGLERVFALRNTFTISSVNISIGGGHYTSQATCDADHGAMKAAIDNLRAINIATAIASGNDGFTDALSGPACISSAISVGSTTKSNVVSSFSNSATFLNLLAPGSSINSSVPGGGFHVFSGTSMAAPHVAGAWAVLKSKAPGASVTQVLSALTSTGVSIGHPVSALVKPRIELNGAVTAIGTSNQPGNDAFANPVVIRSLPDVFFANTTNATTESGEVILPTCDGVTFGAGKTVWYRYVVPTTRRLRISTAGSNFDTVLAAIRNPQLGGTWVGFCADDSNGLLTTELNFVAQAGEIFMIQAGGYYDPFFGQRFAASGALRLSINQVGSLTTTTVGGGTITSTPAGINCGPTCFSFYDVGTPLQLQATPAAGRGFAYWSGACATAVSPCSLTVSGDHQVTANFVNCTPRPRVQVSVTNNGDQRLRVVLTAGAGVIKQVSLGANRPLLNASVDIVGGATGIIAQHTHVPQALTPTVTMLVSRRAAGAVTVPMDVIDACGTWTTFAGGGASAF